MITGIRLDEGLRELLDVMPAGNFFCSLEGEQKVKLVNRELLMLYGCNDEGELAELTGGSLKGMLDIRDYPRMMEAIEKDGLVKDGGRVIRIASSIVTKDGDARSVELYVRIVKDRDGTNWINALMMDKGRCRVLSGSLLDKEPAGARRSLNEGSLTGKSIREAALNAFGQDVAFEVAAYRLMDFLGSYFSLDQIVIYINQQKEAASPAAFCWEEGRCFNLSVDNGHSSLREKFHICHPLYDREGIAILQQRDYQEYSDKLKRLMDEAGAATMLLAAIYIDGRYTGMIALTDTRRERRWLRAQRQAVSEMADVVAFGAKNALRLIEAREQAEYYRNRDALTGLMRYDKFKEECQSLMDAGGNGYVLVSSDIKGFKFINEALGYTQGDNILRMYGSMLGQIGLEAGCCTRVAGDHFLSFGICGMERSDFVNVIEALNDEFDRLLNEIYPEVFLMMRSGIYFIEEDCRKIDSAADRAIIARKSVDYITKATAVMFNDGAFDSNYKENEIINRMEYALQHGEFRVYLQPKVSLQDMSLVGAEALVRWQREDGRLISPVEFIPLFEKNGFISQVDAYMRQQVCRGLKEWIEAGGEPTCISINLSGVDFESEQLVSSIVECADTYGLDHRYLEFELTETAFLRDSDRAYGVMRMLREDGFTIAIDDFGSGYSIMNMMADIPADVIKLDCGFVQSCGKTDRGREFLKDLIQMTNKMGFLSLCEGIETKEQLEMLRDMGCQVGQGYYFSRPVPMEQFFQQLKQE